MSGVSAFARAADVLPTFAFAPGGTVSTVARNWGLRGPMQAYAERLVREVIAGELYAVRRPTLRVAAEHDRIGFVFGAGLVSNFFDTYYASNTLGYRAAARIVARVFAGSLLMSLLGSRGAAAGDLARRILIPTPALLSTDGFDHTPNAWSLVVASVVRDLGLHMLVTPRAGQDPSRFHAIGSPLGASALGPQLPRVLLGKKLRGAENVDVLARELRLRFTAERDAYVLDGELFRSRTVTVTAGPQIDVYQL
jgi:hypothetical protein